MKKVILASCGLLLSLSASVSSLACGMHGFDVPFGGAPWASTGYNHDVLIYNEPSENVTPVKKDKPVFSNAASRASELAKSRLLSKKAVEANTETSDSEESSESEDANTKL